MRFDFFSSFTIYADALEEREENPEEWIHENEE